MASDFHGHEPDDSLPSDQVSDQPRRRTGPADSLPADQVSEQPRRRAGAAWDDDAAYEVPAPPPPPPQPGFTFSVLWCLLMLVLSQVILPVAVIIALLVYRIIQDGFDKAMEWLQNQMKDGDYMAPALVVAHGSIFLLAVLILRLMHGREWSRLVAIRLPHPTHVVLTLIGLPAFWITAMGAYLLAAQYLPNLDEVVNLMTTLLSLMLLVGAIWLLIRAGLGFDWVKGLAAAPLGVQFVGAGVAVVLLSALGTGIYHVIYIPSFQIPMLAEKGFMEQFVEQLRKWPPVMAVLIIGGCPGFSEEFWCRAFLGRGLVARHGVVLGVLWTSVFFGAIHVHPHQGTMAIVAGLGLHYVYLTSRSLLIPMFLHFLNNSLAVVADKIPGRFGETLAKVDTKPEDLPYALFLAAGVLLSGVLWAFYVSRGRLERHDGTGEPAWQPAYPGVELPPQGSGTEVRHALPGIFPCLVIVAGAGAMIVVLWAL